jgi:hypothetical protein
MHVFELIENKTLFDARDDRGEYCPILHLQQMTALMGPPPEELLRRARLRNEFFNAEGTLFAQINTLAYTSCIQKG